MMKKKINPVEQYLNNGSWRLKENANQIFCVGHLMNYVSTMAIKDYWLNQVFNNQARRYHEEGRIHIHDLSRMTPYCGGFSTSEVIKKGIPGPKGRISSTPPRHLSSLINQLTNYVGVLSQEFAGAIALNDFAVYLAPFVRADGLDYKTVKQEIQQFVFHMNQPNRWAGECVDEETDILTESGWKKYSELQYNEKIYTYKDNKLVLKPLRAITVREHNGEMYRIIGQNQNQLITPGHRVLYYLNGKEHVKTAERLFKENKSFAIPRAGMVVKEPLDISTNYIKLLAMIFSDGYIGKRNKDRIQIYKSRCNIEANNFIKQILSSCNISYDVQTRCRVNRFGKESVDLTYRFSRPDSKRLKDMFILNKKLPSFLLDFNREQARLFINTFMYFDSCISKNAVLIDNNYEHNIDIFQHLGVIAGFGSMVMSRGKSTYVRFLIGDMQHNCYITKENYTGTVWCPNVENETWIARRNNNIFITKNCPFTNLTINLTVPEDLKNTKAIVGGKEIEETYGDFEKEMHMITDALLEVLIEGDSKGTPFTFPVVTVGITEDFPWESEIAKKIFQVTAKYGTPFFENFKQETGRDPKDSRSMCCFSGKTKINFKTNGIFKNLPLQAIASRYDNIEVLQDGKWVKAKPIKVDYSNPFYEITLRNGFKYVVTDNHIHKTDAGDKITTSLKKGDKLKFSFTDFDYDGSGSYNLGKFIGYYLAEGSAIGKDIQFSLNENETEMADFIQKIASDYFGATTSVWKNTGKSITVSPNSAIIKQFIDTIVSGKATDKHLLNWYKYNKEMLHGIWDGWFEGDGKTNRTEIYTSSKKLAYQMKDICRILGIRVNLRERENQKIQAFGKEYTRNLYTLHVCKKEDEGGRIYLDNDFVQITKIKRVPNTNKKAFCIEVQDNIPYFEIGDGLYTHNCRLRMDTNEIRQHTGGIFGNADSMGSLAVVTINLNRIGYEANHNSKAYFELLDDAMGVAKDILCARRAQVNKMLKRGLYPYTRYYLKNYKTFFSTIGVIGGNESMMNFMGKGLEEKEAIDFMSKVLDHMNMNIHGFQKETGDLFNLEAVPGEGAMYSFALKDYRRYGDKIYLSGKNEPFLTNSTLPPVEETDFLKLIKDQENLQTKYTGGTTLNIYLGEKLSNYKQARTLVKAITTNTKIPYFSITPIYSLCKEHGYISGEVFRCPTCNRNCEVFSRVVGYLKPKQQYNKGKLEEFKNRKYYDISDIEKLNN